jgi:hypothetical protein
MQVFLLPKGIIDQLTKITRRFLWRGHESFSGGHCLARWDALCLPKKFSGLYILDLRAQNMALLLRWLWLYHAQRDSLWSQQLRLKLEITSLDELPNLTGKITFFIKDLFCACLQILWSKNVTGIFTSKSAYQFIINPDVQPLYPTIPWSLAIPPKVK